MKIIASIEKYECYFAIAERGHKKGDATIFCASFWIYEVALRAK